MTVDEASLITDFIDSQGTESPPSGESLTTEPPTEESTQITNSSLDQVEPHDERLRDRFLNSTIELIGLGLSTSNETFVNTTETTSVVNTDESPHEDARDM